MAASGREREREEERLPSLAFNTIHSCVPIYPLTHAARSCLLTLIRAHPPWRHSPIVPVVSATFTSTLASPWDPPRSLKVTKSSMALSFLFFPAPHAARGSSRVRDQTGATAVTTLRPLTCWATTELPTAHVLRSPSIHLSCHPFIRQTSFWYLLGIRHCARFWRSKNKHHSFNADRTDNPIKQIIAI